MNSYLNPDPHRTQKMVAAMVDMIKKRHMHKGWYQDIHRQVRLARREDGITYVTRRRLYGKLEVREVITSTDWTPLYSYFPLRSGHNSSS